MADMAGNQDITPAAPTPAEQAALAQVPAGASADEAALDAKINAIAGGELGVSMTDARFKQEASNDTAASGAEESGKLSGDGNGSGADDPGNKPVEPVAGASNTKGEGVGEAAAIPGGQADEGAQPGNKSAQQTPPTPKAEEFVAVPEAKDYAVKVLDAEGKEYSITKIEDLPEDFMPKNNRQVMEILRDIERAEQSKSADDAKRIEAEAHNAAVTQQTAARDEMLTGWDAEIQALQAAGHLDKPKLTSDNPKYLEDPAMKHVAGVFEFMEKTNNERRAAGNPNMLRSFTDAYNIMRFNDMTAKEVQAAKDEAETAKLKASVQGGGTSNSGGSKAPVYIAGQAQEARDLL